MENIISNKITVNENVITQPVKKNRIFRFNDVSPKVVKHQNR